MNRTSGAALFAAAFFFGTAGAARADVTGFIGANTTPDNSSKLTKSIPVGWFAASIW